MPERLVEHAAWLRLRGLREATITQRIYAVRRVGRWLDHAVVEASADELRAWQLAHVNKLGALAMGSEVSHVWCYLAWCVNEGLRTDNPAYVLIRPKKPRRVPRPISEVDLSSALLLADRPVRTMLVLAAYAGLRAGEIARLQRSHILDSATPPTLLVDGKGGRERIIPLSDYVLTELRAYGLPTRGTVFRRIDGRPGGYTPARVSQLCNRWLHDSGINATLHQLRHRFATRCYGVSRDLRLVQELLGHSDPATTAGYCAYASGRAGEVVESITDRPALASEGAA